MEVQAKHVIWAIVLVGILLLFFTLIAQVTKKRRRYRIQSTQNQVSDPQYMEYEEVIDEIVPEPEIPAEQNNQLLEQMERNTDTFGDELRNIIAVHNMPPPIIDEQDIINARIQAVENRQRQRQQNPPTMQHRDPQRQALVIDMGFMPLRGGGGLFYRGVTAARNGNPQVWQTNRVNTDLVKPALPKKRKKKQKMAEYYQEFEKHGNSSQNVHDSQVNRYLARKYSRLIELNKEVEIPTIEGMSKEEIIASKKVHTFIQVQKRAEEYIQKEHDAGRIDSKEARIRRKKINLILETIRNSNTLTSIHPKYEPIHEDDILMNVWDRIHQPVNKGKERSLEISLIDALLDGVEEKTEVHNMVDNLIGHLMGTTNTTHDDPFLNKYGTVCINGRAGRMLSCFTLLDDDDVLQEPEKDLNEVANESYTKVPRILNKQYELYEIKNPTIKGKTIKELYNCADISKLTDAESEEVERFEKHVKDLIKETLIKDYKGIVPENKLNEIIQTAQSGI